MAGLSLLDGTGARSKKFRKKKALVKAKEATKEALAKAQDSKSETKEADKTKVTNDTMKAGFQEDLEKTKQAQETAKGAMTAAASKMFTFSSNLLSPESKYTWNKIVSEQTESNPFVSLQGVSLEGPRGMSCESFNGCIIFTFSLHFPSMQLSKKSITS
jgi:hypothetical protein